MGMWLIWIVIALIAALIEVVASGLVFLGVAGAALTAAIVAAFLGSSTLAVLGAAGAFAVVSVFYLLALRPPVLRLMSGQRSGLLGSHHGASGIVGRRAIVTQAVSSDGGQIRIGQGEFWSARSYNPGEKLAEGARVEVLLRDGLTALVAPVDEHESGV